MSRRQRTAHLLAAPLTLFSLIVTLCALQKFTGISVTEFGAALLPQAAYDAAPRSPLDRVAFRLRHRLLLRYGTSPSWSTLHTALEERQRLLAHVVTATFTSDGDVSQEPWQVSLQQYPLWVRFTLMMGEARFRVDRDSIRDYLTAFGIPGIPRPVHGVIHSSRQDGAIVRAITEGKPEDGMTYDVAHTANLLADAFVQDTPSVRIALQQERGHYAFVDDSFGEPLVLLASGRSNFAGSPWGRIKNIEKAVREHITNVLVSPGEAFSFNATLGGPITQSRWWYVELGIFGNGEELRPTPGGGLCQTSTTVYRAALAGGFPIVERAGHSLFVGYYKKYGVGLDATIFPGSHDLVFRNDTAFPLLVQSAVDGTDLRVDIYGVPDGRRVVLNGPYFAQTAPDDLLVRGRRIRENEIAWVQTVLHPDGTEERNVIISTYRKGVPVRQLLAEAQKGESA